MRFWDASALVPLLVEEDATSEVLDLLTKDPAVLAWWGSEVECASAIARLERDGNLTAAGATEALERLRAFSASWHEVQPLPEVKEVAVRFLRVHPLRAADALQLAAAFVAAERRPPTLELVLLDDRLALAATREGFVVVQPSQPGPS